MTIGTQAKTKKTAAATPAKTAKAATKLTTKAAPKPAATAVKPQVSAEQRRHYIEVAAYYIAERRGFSGTSVNDDWIQAEFEIDRLLRAGKLSAC